MNARARFIAMISALLLAYFGFNQVLRLAFPPMRMDLTEKRLFTLSPGSQRIIASVNQDTELTLYYSEKEARPYPQFRQYAQRVSEKIEEYAAQSGIKIRLRIIDPEPYSSAEDIAIGEGILAIPLEDGAGPLYFGLTATTAVRKQSIGFIKPESEQYLEYELSKLIQSVQSGEKPKVLLVSDLPVSGNTNPAIGPVTPAWVVYRQLSERYQLSHLSPRALTIPADTDVLWVMHPRNWPEAAVQQVQAFVENGGHAVIVLDPNAESVPVFSGSNPLISNLYLASDMPALLQRWGVRYDPNMVVLDSKYAWLMQLNENQFPKRNPALISLPGEAMNQRDPVTADLDRIVLSSTGAMTLTENSPLQIEPLLQSSDSSRLIDVTGFRLASEDPEKLLNGFVSSQEPFVLAARFTGKVSSKGRPDKRLNFIVVADSDFLSDRLWVLENNLFGQPVFSAQASNGDFFFNCIDQLSGTDDLISIRSRGKVSRPFEKVDQLRRSAEQRYRDKQTALLLNLEKVQSEINVLQENGSLSKATQNSPRYQKLMTEKIKLRRSLRDIQRELNQDVERLGIIVKLVNILGIALLLLIIGAVVAIRKRLFKDYARVSHGAA